MNQLTERLRGTKLKGVSAIYFPSIETERVVRILKERESDPSDWLTVVLKWSGWAVYGQSHHRDRDRGERVRASLDEALDPTVSHGAEQI